MKINFLSSNNFKTSYSDINKSTTIDSLKIKYYREHSDKLPSPSTVYIENEERDTSDTEEDIEFKEQDDADNDMDIETTTTTITKNKPDIYKKAHSSIIHPHQIRFIFSGKQLENFSTIADNNITEENTILVVVSPFIMNIEKQFVKYLKMQDEKDQHQLTNKEGSSDGGENEQETSDTVFLGTSNSGIYGMINQNKINFKLSINERSFKSIRNLPTPEPLDKLSDQDTFALLNRIDTIDNDKLSNKPNVGATKPNVPLIPMNTNMVIKNEVSQQKLATELDRLTLLDKPILQKPSIFEIDDSNGEVIGDKMVTDSTTTTTTTTPTTSFSNTISIIKPLLKIISCTPIGEVSFTKAITVMFNRPFLPLTNDQKDYDIPIVVEPSIKDAKWISTDGIVFKYQISDSLTSTLKSCFPLSTNYRVMVDSKQFEKLYNEDIDEQTFTFSTSSQNLKYWEFNNSLINPQIKIQFTQPIKYRSNSSNPERSFQIALYEKNLVGGISDTLLRQLQFSIIDIKNEICHWKNKDSSIDNDKTIYLKINTSLVGKFSKVIKCLITMADIGSVEGPNFNNSNVLQVQFDTLQLLTIQPELLNASALENASHVSFVSNISLNSKLLNTTNSKEISKFVSITPKVGITKLSCYGKQLTIHGKFKHSTIYYVNIVAIPDSTTQQFSNGYGVFSFPPVPIKIWAQAPLYQGSVDQFYNLNSEQPPIFKINSKGTSKLIVRAHTVNEITLEKASRISGSVKFNVMENPNEEISTTAIDLSSFFGGRNPQSCNNNLLLFTVYPNKESKSGIFGSSIEQVDKIVEKQFLLQYSNLNISTVQLGCQSIYTITDTLTKEHLKDVSLSFYDHSRPTDKSGFKLINVRNGIRSVDKQDSNDCSHLIATVKQPNSNKEIHCLYQFELTKKKEKPYSFEWVMMSSVGVARPGDTVNIKGMIRVITDAGVVVPNEKFFDTVLDIYEPNEIKEISYSLVDGNNKPVTEGKVQLDEYGCFTIDIELTLNMNLGTTTLSCTYQKQTHSYTGISVEEFKRKSFLVHHQLYSSSQSNSYEMDTPFSIELFAKSYTDEIIANTIVDWNITVNTQPPTTHHLNKEYNFKSSDSDLMYSNFNSFKYTSKRNSTGRHNLDMILQDCKYRCHLSINATVSDETNNQQEFSKQLFIENNQPRFFGILKNSAITHLINVDQDLIINMLVCDYKSIPCDDGKIEVLLEKIPYEEDLPKQRVLTSTITPQQLTDGNLKFSYQFKQTGYYSLRLTYCNDNQLPLCHDLSVFVMGQQTPYELEYKEESAPIKQVKSKQTNTFNVKPKVDITCSLDKEIYSVGDVVRVGIASKIQIGKGYLAIFKKDTVVDLFPIVVKDGQLDYSFKLLEKHSFHPILACYLEGNILVGINNNGGGYGDEDSYQKVSRLTSSFVKVHLNVNYGSKKLTVSIDKCDKFQTPSKDQSIVISVRDHLNEKLISNAQVTCMIVDQSVLDCTSHTVEDNWNPYDLFYRQCALNGRTKFDSILDKTIYNDPEDIQPIILDDSDDEDSEELKEIKIKYLGGRIIVLKVNSETTMDQVSAMITERDGLPKLSQRLFYLNKQIGQESTIKLKDLSIKNGSTLNLVIRLSGGSLTPAATTGTAGSDKPDPVVVVAQKIFLRSNFKAVALFNTLKTNENGTVTFNYKLPDNLSTFRVMVIVNDKKDCFGTKEGSFTSTLPVIVRQCAPRFLNHLDQVTFPITISSIVNFDVFFEAAVRSNNCRIEQQGFRGIIPAKSRLLVPITVDAIVSNVSSEFQFVVKTQTIDLQQEICDAIAFKIPIHSSTVLESTTISHSLVTKSNESEYSSHPLKFDNWRLLDTELGGLSINFSSNRLEKVSVSTSDLFNYKYSCSEQLSSKLMGIFVYEKNPASASEEDLKKIDVSKIDQDKKNMVAILKKRQTRNHSFTYFDGSESGTYEFVSLYVYLVLHSISEISAEAKTLSKDFDAYSKSDANVYTWDEIEYNKDKFQYLLLKSFACFVYGTVLGKSPSTEFVCQVLDKAKQNLTDTQYFEIFVHLGQFLQTHHDFKKIFNYVTISGDGGYLDTSSAIYGFSCSNRTQSMLILLLLQCKSTPVNDAMIEKLVVGTSHFLCDGRYSNTLENSFNLYSLYKYETKYQQSGSPSTVANIILNNQYVGCKDITFDKSKNYSIEIPFSQVLKNQSSIIIEKKSNSSLYYTLNLSYGSLNPFCKAVTDRGFVISREFIPISKPSDLLIHGDIEYGSGNVNIEIKSGSRIKVVLKIVVSSVSSFVVIKDRLPAGLEPLLLESSKIYNGYWSKHVNVRECGIEIFSNLLYPGQYTYSYIALATTKGKFISPSAKVELMYTPSSFGRSKSDLVLIK